MIPFRIICNPLKATLFTVAKNNVLHASDYAIMTAPNADVSLTVQLNKPRVTMQFM